MQKIYNYTFLLVMQMKKLIINIKKKRCEYEIKRAHVNRKITKKITQKQPNLNLKQHKTTKISHSQYLSITLLIFHIVFKPTLQ
jgi:phosphoserine phosphatase